MTAPAADGPGGAGSARDDAARSISRSGEERDEVDAVRAELADTLDALERKLDPRRRWNDVRSRVTARAAERPVPAAAVAVAGASVLVFAVVLVVRVARR